MAATLHGLFALPPPVAPSRRREEAPKPAINDLRTYLAHAELASIRRYDTSHPYALPPRGSRSVRPGITVRGEPRRKIRHIWKYDKVFFDNTVKEFHKNYIYDAERGRPYRNEHWTKRTPYQALSLPAYDFEVEDLVATNIPYPCSMADTCKWLEAPFKTMQRAIHLAFTEARLFRLVDTTDPSDTANREKWRSFVWRFHPDEVEPQFWHEVMDKSGKTALEPMQHDLMTVVVQPPYSLSWQDFINVSDVKKISNVSPTGARRKRVWAKLVDTCKRNNTRFFVITTYEGWLFGKFNDDWSIVYQSGVREYGDSSPNVIQSFVYWAASALELSGTGKMIPVLVPRSKADRREEQETEEQLLGPTAGPLVVSQGDS